uniref:C-type lectin domain-containing protein n=1 Tax=Panagrellus redivivus TaxID=6233 RepID=A0A7E4ZR91_PANRE
MRLYVVALFSLSLLNVFNIGYTYTNFIHLLGWTLKADVVLPFATNDANDCAIECTITTNCTGFQMLHGTGSCNLLTMVRGYSFNVSQCEYYLKQSTNVTITGRKLTSNIDIAIQNAVYDSQLPCPDGWTDRNLTCYLNVSQSTCNEYASFLEASYDDGCSIHLFDVTYYCPDSTFTLGNYINGHYCIKVIDKWPDSTNIGNLNQYEFANQYCYDQTGGYLASIHSQAENDDIHTQQGMLGGSVTNVMIGLVINITKILTTNQMWWMDGTERDYNYWADTSTVNPFYYTVMTDNGYWRTTMDGNLPIKSFRYIACKQNAFATLT